VPRHVQDDRDHDHQCPHARGHRAGERHGVVVGRGEQFLAEPGPRLAQLGEALALGPGDRELLDRQVADRQPGDLIGFVQQRVVAPGLADLDPPDQLAAGGVEVGEPVRVPLDQRTARR
jgi:hypothetical protein